MSKSPAALNGPPPRRRWALGALVLLGVAGAAGGGTWLWQQQQAVVRQGQAPASGDQARLAALDSQLGALQQRLSLAEQRPAALEAELGALQQRLTRAEQRPAELEGQINALQQRLTQLEQRPAPAPVAPAAGKPAATQGTDTAAVQAPDQRPDTRPTAAEQQEHAAADRAARLARLQVAAVALEAGQKVGEIPGAPPALAKFAYADPPTQSSLRLFFPAAARAAEMASDPSGAKSLAGRVWRQVQSLVTVRQGEKMILGAPASRALALAQIRLDAGDLAGAVAALNQLDPAAAKAMAGWRSDAQALLDARAALAVMERS